jgi:hypothetical protein
MSNHADWDKPSFVDEQDAVSNAPVLETGQMNPARPRAEEHLDEEMDK